MNTKAKFLTKGDHPSVRTAATATDRIHPGMSTQSERKEAVTEILGEINRGDRDALNRLMPYVYDELREIAHRKLRYERPDHTFSTTDLVNEAYLRLADQTRIQWTGRQHFFAVAAQVMRRILVNYAKRRNADKRGGSVPKIAIDAYVEQSIGLKEPPARLLALDEALTRMEAFNERGCRVVEYRFFGGLTHDEIAEVLGVSTITVRRAWSAARNWLAKELAIEDTS